MLKSSLFSLSRLLSIAGVITVLFGTSSTQAQTLRYGTASATISVSGKNPEFQKDFVLQIPTYEVFEQYVLKQTTCETLVCKDTLGSVRDGDWKGFFSAPRSKKAKALADAIKGIGEKSAERILDLGFFSSKPKTWSLFEREIHSAQVALKHLGNSYNFENAVLNQYGRENARNLGYYSETSCSVQTYSCTIPAFEKVERFAGSIPRSVSVSVQGSVLQSFESDRITVEAGLQTSDIQLVYGSQNHNRYRNEIMLSNTGKVLVKVYGYSRIKDSLPSGVVQSQSLSAVRGGYSFKVVIDPRYLPNSSDMDQGSELYVRYSVCHASWFDTCYEVVQDDTEVQLNHAVNNIHIPSNGNFEKGSAYFVRYQVYRVNSLFYTAEPTSRRSTTTVRFN